MGATLHVLLVEDSEFDSLTHRTRIRAAFPGSTVTVVERLSEALAFLDANRVEVVLTDLGLPDSSGLATVEAFALVAETVPVIVLSGAEPSEELRLRAIELGAQDFLLKGAAVPEVYRSCIGYAIKRKELDLEARRLARTDTLTGLLNRRAIIERIKTALDGATFPDDTVTVAFCDVDDFKAINDLYGHSVGDAILQEIATTISSKAPDAAVGRLGGDEFCLVCAGHSFREVVDAVSELNEAFSAPITVGRRSLTVSCSWGVVRNTWGCDAYSILGEADRAMYRAKKRGGGVVTYTSGMRVQDQETEQTQSELLEQARSGFGQFLMHFQPIMGVASLRPVAYEALLRWRHPDRGLLTASSFVALLHEAGLTAQLDEWVLTTVLGQLPTIPHDARVHINVSPSTLRLGEHYCSLAEQLVTGAGVEPGRLVLEFTEEAVLNDTLEDLSRIEDLKRSGFSIAIDDFGTGYSALAYLDHLPIDWLKLDGRFLIDGSYRLIEGLAQIADRIGVRVIVEGVETAEQHDRIAAIPIHWAQGSYYSGASHAPWAAGPPVLDRLLSDQEG